MHRIPALYVAALLTLLNASTLRAQLGIDLIVGEFDSDQTTNFTSGTNTYDNTYVGYDSSVSNNTLGVYNAGTLLTNSTGGLYVGYQGSTGNSLVISNGGTVAAAGDGYISFGNSGEVGNNTALVTGSGSLLTIGDPSDPFSFGGRFLRRLRQQRQQPGHFRRRHGVGFSIGHRRRREHEQHRAGHRRGFALDQRVQSQCWRQWRRPQSGHFQRRHGGD